MFFISFKCMRQRHSRLVQPNPVNPLHTNLQVSNFQRCKHELHQHQAWVKFHCLCLLLLMILQLSHLPPPLPPPLSNSSCLLTGCQPLYASCCTKLLYFSKYCTVRLKLFSLFSAYFLGIICEKSMIKYVTVQYYIANCVSWVPRLILLDLRTTWTYECALRMELVCM